MPKKTYKVTQLLRSVYENISHTVYQCPDENEALRVFHKLKHRLPSEYFEVVEIEEKETLISYTSNKKGSWFTEKLIDD
jgi:hypothetical protein